MKAEINKKLTLFPIINPENPIKIAWDIFLAFFIFVMGFIISFGLIFKLPQNQFLFWLTTLFFFIDIFLNFHTPIRVGHKLISDRVQIAKHYLKSWFAIDLIIAFPFTFFIQIISTQFFGHANIDTSFESIFIFIRLSKLFINTRTFNKIGEILTINPAIMRLSIFFLWFTLVIHFFALGWIYIGAAETTGSIALQYTRALYWTVTTVATIGYGDITPDKNNLVQLIFTISVQLVGVGIYSYVIGNVANLISNIDVQKNKMIQKKEEINSFIRSKQIPKHLQSKIKEYFNYLWYTRKHVSDYSILEELPFTLKNDISYFLNSDVIQLVPLFKNASEIFIREIIQDLKLLVFLPGDKMIREGEYGDAMYFLARGEVEVLVGETAVARIKSGNVFGEMSLINGERRSATIRAVDFCDVYILSKGDFDTVRSKYPEFDKQVIAIVEARRKENEKNKRQQS